MHFTLNGAPANVDAHPMKRLLDVLREDCRLTGTKEGCGEGECGACSVLVDGALVVSCLVPFAQVEGAAVTTIEGLGDDHPLQHHFMNEAGAQCGICTPGMIMAARMLGPKPTLDEIRVALAGNLCRCTGYEAIYRAIFKARHPERSTRHPERSTGHPERSEGSAVERAGADQQILRSAQDDGRSAQDDGSGG